LVVLAFQAKGVEHLKLVAVVDEHAAVAAILPLSRGHERRAELNMELAAAEGCLAASAGLQPAFGRHFAAFKIVDARAVEEYDCVFGRLGAQGRALSLDLLERAQLFVRRVAYQDHSILNSAPQILTFKNGRSACGIAL